MGRLLSCRAVPRLRRRRSRIDWLPGEGAETRQPACKRHLLNSLPHLVFVWWPMQLFNGDATDAPHYLSHAAQ